MPKSFRYFIIILICFQTKFYAQETEKTSGIFYKASLATTIAVNENYEIFDEYSDTFFIPNSIFVNNTLGYQFDTRSMVGVNFEYNYHADNRLHFLPIHLSFQYNVLQFDDNVFLRGSYGRLVGISKDFETGTFYRVGAGYQLFDANFKNSWHFGIDFTRKRFGFRQTEKLSSVSIFLEFMLF